MTAWAAAGCKAAHLHCAGSKQEGIHPARSYLSCFSSIKSGTPGSLSTATSTFNLATMYYHEKKKKVSCSINPGAAAAGGDCPRATHVPPSLMLNSCWFLTVIPSVHHCQFKLFVFFSLVAIFSIMFHGSVPAVFSTYVGFQSGSWVIQTSSYSLYLTSQLN